jgi:hypothetical protein
VDNYNLIDGGRIVTHRDLSPLLPLGLAVLASLAVLIGFAMVGNVVAIVILAVAGTAALMSLGVALNNAARNVELRGQAARASMENERWRLNVEENLSIMQQTADVQSRQALGLQRHTRTALAAAGQPAANVQQLVLDGIYDDDD